MALEKQTAEALIHHRNIMRVLPAVSADKFYD